jgi:hypothetical protein
LAQGVDRRLLRLISWLIGSDSSMWEPEAFLVRIDELPAFDNLALHPALPETVAGGRGPRVDEVSSWGNRDCVVGNFDRWPAYRWWHSLRNEPDLPVQVWAFARRPSRG